MTTGTRWLVGLLSIGVLVSACTSDSGYSSASTLDPVTATELNVVETPMESIDDRGTVVSLFGEPVIVRGDTIVINSTNCFSPAIQLSRRGPDGRGHVVYKYLELSEEAPRQMRMRVPASIDTGTYQLQVICGNGWDVFEDMHRVSVEVTGPWGPAVPSSGVVLEDEPTLLILTSEGKSIVREELSPYPEHYPGVIG